LFKVGNCERNILVREVMEEHDGKNVRIKDLHSGIVYGRLDIREEDSECYFLWIGFRYKRGYFHDVERFGVRS